MADSLTLPPCVRVSGRVRPPGSKSISNRVLPLAALASGDTRITGLLDSDDVRHMRAALGRLGADLRDEGDAVVVRGLGGAFRAAAPTDLYLGNSGTATRILTALLAAGEGEFAVDGNARMRERPIGDLVDALRPLAGAAGTRIEYAAQPDYPPLRIRAAGLAGGDTRVRGDISSQFLTGLLMALPLCRGAAGVEVEGELVSASYVELTLGMLAGFGAAPARGGGRSFRFPQPAGYRSPGVYAVEPDASSASYFLAAGAIAGGVEVEGVGRDSVQGDAGFAEVLARMGARVERGPDRTLVSRGALRGVDADMESIPDSAMTLAVVALFAEGPTTIRGIHNWRVKETDRVAAMAAELRKLGAAVEEGPDHIRVEPPARLREAAIDTYDDHRIAMCFSLACLGGVPVTIRDPGCTAKTYPGYFRDFASLRAG